MRYELSDYEWSVIKPMLPNNMWHERSYLKVGVPPSQRDRRHPQTPVADANSRLLVGPSFDVEKYSINVV